MSSQTDDFQFARPTALSIAKHSWWLFKSRALTFFALALAAYLPSLLITIWSISLRSKGLMIGIGLVPAVLMTFFVSFLVYSAHNAVEGKYESPGQVAEAVFRRLWSLLLLGLLIGICTFILNMAASRLIQLLLVPDIKIYIFSTMTISILVGSVFAASVPICLIEKRGGLSSLLGGLELIKSHLATILILVAAVNLLDYLIRYLIEAFLPGRIGGGGITFHVLSLLTTALFLALEYVMFTVVYYDLRDWRDREKVVEVFH